MSPGDTSVCKTKSEPTAEEVTAYRERDRLWCQALIEILELSEIAAVTKRVNELRPD